MKMSVMNSRFFRLMTVMISLVLVIDSCEVAEDLIGGNATVTKLEGDWTCDEDSEIFKSTKSVYSVAISPDPDNMNGVIIDNFYGVNAPAYASVAGMSLIISSQTIEGGYEVAGSGIISSNFEEINWTYTVDDGSGTVDHATAVYTKN